MSPAAALVVVCNCVVRKFVQHGLVACDAAIVAASGPVPPKKTATPEPMLMALVMSTVRLAFVVADGVVYARPLVVVQAGTPFSVNPVPKAVAVCANKPALIWLNVPEKWPEFQISKLLLPAVIGAELYAVPTVSVFFQFVSVIAVVRVVPFVGEPVCAPVSRLNSNVAAMVVINYFA